MKPVKQIVEEADRLEDQYKTDEEDDALWIRK
jgi:hypothetical protein